MAAPTIDAYRCLASFGAERLRVTRLTTGGAMIDGPDNLYVSDQLIQIGHTPQVVNGDVFQQRSGSGALCVDLKEPDRVNRTQLTTSLCSLDAELQEFLVGGTLVQVGGITIGYAAPGENDEAAPVCVEAWSKAIDGSGQAEEDGDALYWHFVWPYVTWVQGAQTLERGVQVTPFTGDGRGNSAINLGPDNDWPHSFDTFVGYYLDDAIPDANCGALELELLGS